MCMHQVCVDHCFLERCFLPACPLSRERRENYNSLSPTYFDIFCILNCILCDFYVVFTKFLHGSLYIIGVISILTTSFIHTNDSRFRPWHREHWPGFGVEWPRGEVIQIKDVPSCASLSSISSLLRLIYFALASLA